MIKSKKLKLLIVLSFLFTVSYTQNINWMIGVWKGAGNTRKAQVVREINITSVGTYNFTGTRTIQVNDHNNTKIITEIFGHINKDTFYIKDGAIILKKEPPHSAWVDCSDCKRSNRVIIDGDSVLLTITVSHCQVACDGLIAYYKLLPDLDTAGQRDVVNMFGTPEQIAAFKPFEKVAPPVATADPDAIKQSADSIKKTAAIAKKRQQQIDDSLQNVASIAKQKRQQEIADSLKNIALIAKQNQQRYYDSVKLAKIRQQQIDDSLQTAATIAKKRQQKIDDSLQNVASIAKQKRQQDVADSLKNAALIVKRNQQRYDDSVKLAKIRQQQIDDSLQTAAAIVKKRQQRISDSLQNVANIAKQKRQQEIADSLKNAALIAKQNQQRYDDSVKLAKIHQQRIQDSLQTAAAVAKKRQQKIDDSLQNVASIAKLKRQQEIADSLRNAALIAKRNQQRYDDSVKFAKIRQQRIQDSLQTVAALEKKRQQFIDDSLKNVAAVAKIKQQQYDDSVKIAKAKPVRDTSQPKAIADKSKALVQRDNVLLQTYHLKNPDILIELFDNAQIDGDRVSVYHNNALIVNNQMLLKEPITFKVHADAASRTHEFVLIAENLGTIPPNTALMRVTADNQVYKLSVKTDLKTNAKIIFYYDGN